MKRPSSKHTIFHLDCDEISEQIRFNSDDLFFEEALGDYREAGDEKNVAFVGTLVSKRRFIIAIAVTVFIFFSFIGRASALQLIHGEYYRALAEGNRTQIHSIPSERGLIYDRNGIILAENEPIFRLIARANQLPSDFDDYSSVVIKLSEVLHRSESDLLAELALIQEDEAESLIADDILYDDAMAFYVNREDYSGFYLEMTSQRRYITDTIPSLSHVLGFTAMINEDEYEGRRDEGYRSFDPIGKQGLELTFESSLRGEYGNEVVEVDAFGHIERIVAKDDPVQGGSLSTTIDARLQSYIESVLKDLLNNEASRASVIVMDPRTGEILSLVSWPAFDANLFSHGISVDAYQELLADADLPLFARAHSGEFPSGSTIKPVFAAAGLIEGIITQSTTFLSTGGLRIGIWYFPDWRASGHGVTDVYHAIADSVNTFFYLIGGGNEKFTGMGIEKLMEYAAQFGFGSPTGVELTSEADGFLPSKAWKLQAKGEQWYIGDTLHASIGQGDFLVTPLQIAASTSIFANDGVRMQPHLLLNDSPEGERIVDEEIATVIQDAMRQTVTQGTAQMLQSLPVAVAGKTGTAQWRTDRENHSWFTGFAPYQDPEIVVTVLIEEGATAAPATPIANAVMRWWFTE
jgi:penicillin-binding protein 2